MKQIEFTRVRDVRSPERATDKAAGLDFFVPNDVHKYVIEFAPGGLTPAILYPSQSILIPSGIHVKLPKGHALIAVNKSGVAAQKGLMVGAAVIDEDYHGELHLHVVNVGDEIAKIEIGEKLVQMLLVPVEYPLVKEVENLEQLYSYKSQRGAGGFGSSNTGENAQ